MRNHLILILLLFTCCAQSATTPSKSEQWSEQLVSQLSLNAIDFLEDGSLGWIVGDIGQIEGAVIQTIDGGKSWYNIGKVTEFLTDVDFLDRHRGYAIGYAGTIIVTENGGRSWRTLRTGTEILNSLSMFDESTGWVVGAEGLLLHTTDGGNSWSKLNTETTEDLWSITVSEDGRGIITGESGTVLWSYDSGKTWTKQFVGYDLAFYDAIILKDRVIIVGEGGTILETTNSDAWQKLESGTDRLLRAITNDGQNLLAVGAAGTIVSSSDGGKRWTVFQLARKANLTDIAVAKNSFFVTSAKGILFKKAR
ncbi:MAG: YCF48-related protein [Acidobacteriota bacterium]|nr:YCF48-related protein [Blastocatellia bacterium]MDW8413183.1 YCF48-related protein [Acidobacteriota bacterium]